MSAIKDGEEGDRYLTCGALSIRPVSYTRVGLLRSSHPLLELPTGLCSVEISMHLFQTPPKANGTSQRTKAPWADPGFQKQNTRSIILSLLFISKMFVSTLCWFLCFCFAGGAGGEELLVVFLEEVAKIQDSYVTKLTAIEKLRHTIHGKQQQPPPVLQHCPKSHKCHSVS